MDASRLHLSLNTVTVFLTKQQFSLVRKESAAISIYVEQFSTCFQQELAKYMCEHQDSISSKLKECCVKPTLQKAHCILEIQRDELPTELPDLAVDFVEDKEVCKNFAEAKDVFLGT